MERSKVIHSFRLLKAYNEAEHYKMWNPYHGLNSKEFKALPYFKNSTFWRLFVIQGFKRTHQSAPFADDDKRLNTRV